MKVVIRYQIPKKIPKLVVILQDQELDKRRKRTTNFVRLYGGSIQSEHQNKLELKSAQKINILRVRQYMYDKNTDEVVLKEIPCICAECLNGKFEECSVFEQTIIRTGIQSIVNEPKRALRSQNRKTEEIEQKPDDEDDEYEECDLQNQKQSDNIDIEFLNNCQPEEIDIPVDLNCSNLSIDMSPSNPEVVTSSQK